MAKAAQLIERARQEAGSDDLGGDDFREGLDRLIYALEHEAGLTLAGEAALDSQLVEILANRLRVEQCYALHPEIELQEIVAPLIGLGLPRTASTALACMLGEDAGFRSLRNWEAMNPCPPPDPAMANDDPRIALAEAAMKRREEVFPRMSAMLPSTATSPTECQLFMGYDFKSQLFQPFAHIPSYVHWLLHEADLVPTYRYVKRVLKLLQFRWPVMTWRLKNPSHSLFIDALDRVFPDARFVMTHRSASAVVPSVADLYLELRQPFSHSIDMAALGEETSAFCELGMRRMIAFREAGNDHRFFDIHYAEFQRDPLSVIGELYDFLGEEFSLQAREAMMSWRKSKPREAQVYERTDPACFGLYADGLEKRFRFYSKVFRIDRPMMNEMPTGAS